MAKGETVFGVAILGALGVLGIWALIRRPLMPTPPSPPTPPPPPQPTPGMVLMEYRGPSTVGQPYGTRAWIFSEDLAAYLQGGWVLV